MTVKEKSENGRGIIPVRFYYGSVLPGRLNDRITLKGLDSLIPWSDNSS
jgi:hypothetical protein